MGDDAPPPGSTSVTVTNPAGGNAPPGDGSGGHGQPGGPPAPPAVETVEQVRARLEAAEKELAAWKGHARTHEDRAKAAKKAADQWTAHERSLMADADRRQAEMDDQIRAAREEAEKTAAATYAAKYGGQLAAAEVRSRCAGRPVDADALIDGANLQRFVAEDGSIDTKAIDGWLDKLAPKGGGRTATDFGQGRRSGGSSSGVAAGAARYAAMHPSPPKPAG